MPMLRLAARLAVCVATALLPLLLAAFYRSTAESTTADALTPLQIP